MTLFTASRPSTIFFPTRTPSPSFPSFFSFSPKRIREPPRNLHLSLGFRGKRAWRRGRGVWEAKGEEEDAFGMGGSVDLEAEIYDFMQESRNPRDFPTKEELIAAGRTDLVEAIATQGGWLTFGWDLEEEEEEGEGSTQEDSRNSQQRFSNGSLGIDSETCSVASSSGRPMQMETGEAAGIEGILSRLERERSLSYAVGSVEKEVNGRTSWSGHDQGDEVLVACKRTGGSIERSSRSISSDFGEESFHHFGGVHSHKGTSADVNGMSSTPEMWRIWSLQRAGNPVTEFEAAEIVPNEDRKKVDHNFSGDVSMDEKMNKVARSVSETDGGRKDPRSNVKGSCQNQIRLRIQHLESELTSALHLLRSRTDGVVSHKGQESSLKELHRLSDAWEFKQTEIMNARDKLRSARAKLAVLEGKMALEIIEAQKIMEEKKKRLDAAQKALRLLRSVCIIWPNSASEVLLAGSFEGWTSQRRMERSNTGIFSLHLKLYPGRYEIKFIVDGVWTIDPLRPIVHNNGHENNLLIVP